jgi:hypothetical protein
MRWWKHGHRRGAVGATRVLTVLSLTNSFDRLARFYRADKSSIGHNYSPHYERHLGPRRFDRILLLEIGVGGHRNRYAGGNSLHVWRDYFPRATIVGLDRFAKELRFLGRRVHVVQGDQSSPDDLALIIERFGPPDVVIDDGSHRGADVIASFTYLFDRMRAGGMYVIEDLDCSFQSGYGGSENPGPGTALGLLDGLVRSLQPSSTRSEAVGAVHVYEDIAFIEKLGP